MSNFNPQFQRIGDILVHNGVISQDDLVRALDDQKTSNENIIIPHSIKTFPI